MAALTSNWTPSAAALRRGGSGALGAGLALGVAALLAALWAAPEWVPLVPVLLVGAGVVAFLLARPDLHLYALLLASVGILHHEPGVQLTEVIYGLYVMFYLATWLLADLYGRRTVVASPESRILAAFLLVTVALVPVAFMNGGLPHTVVREMTSLTMLGFFFPVREVCVRRPEAVRILVGIATVLVMFVVVRNVMLYREVLSNAERLTDMVYGRVVANEHMLAAGSLFGMVFLLHATSARQALVSALVFVSAFGGLLLSLSRGFWLAFVWGCLLLFWVVDGRHRVRMAIMSVLAAVTIGAIAWIFFGNLAQTYITGLLDRFGSVQGSTTRDVSMLGRIYEARAALGHIIENPILGHGAGVPFTFSTILTRTETTTTFIHNGYVYIWYAFGIPGSVLLLAFWWRAIAAGLSAFRRENAPHIYRLAGLGAAASLFCYTLSAMTSNPFWHKDYLLGFGLLAGIAYGARAHMEQRRRPEVLRPVASP